MTDRVKQGKQNKAAGQRFEARVRAYYEKQGWIVSKWPNNVSKPFEQDIGEYMRKLEPAKHTFNPFRKAFVIGTGFPDFVAFKPCKIEMGTRNPHPAMNPDFVKLLNYTLSKCSEMMNDKLYEVIGIEAKSDGYLNPEEKLKCKWYLEKKIFSRILIVRKGKKRGEIVEEDFTTKRMKGGKKE